MVDHKHPYIYLKRDVFYFSKRVPKDLKGYYNRNRIVLSLRTKSLKAAQAQTATLITKLEEDWMKLLESEQATPQGLAPYDVVLKTLCEAGRQDLAETIAQTAVDGIRAQSDDSEVAALAGRFLTVIGKSTVFGPQVATLYIDVYADRDGIEELVEEAGVAGGRPPRRAVRTLEVCLALHEGDVLVDRHEDGAARIDSIDTDAWTFGITDRKSVV